MVGKEGAGGRKEWITPEEQKGGEISSTYCHTTLGIRCVGLKDVGGGKEYTKLRGCQEVNKQESGGGKEKERSWGDPVLPVYGQEEGQVSREMENQIEG